MMRGEGSKQKKACITIDYEKPTKENWLPLCVGRSDDLANKFWPDAEGKYVEQVYKRLVEKMCKFLIKLELLKITSYVYCSIHHPFLLSPCIGCWYFYL
jgi:hypothetical protein